MLLEENWELDSILRDFILGKISEVTDHPIKVRDVVFHIPFLTKEKKFILWKCYWPDCNNCCNRQGRLPLTSNDLISIGNGMKYQKTSEFVQKETVVASWNEVDPSGNSTTITNINLKRKENETPQEDGTYISCRFLDKKGTCTIHPHRPGVCYIYPFSTWMVNEQGKARVHATFQFTGDCPGFYIADNLGSMEEILNEYSPMIYDYNLKSNRTSREGFSSVSFG